jgi:hypothetical protein
MKIDESIPFPGGFADGTGILGKAVIPLGIDDDDRFPTKYRLGNQHIEQARLAHARTTDDQV